MTGDHDPMIGLAIGRFVVRSKLAEGGMGAVYLAVHERLPVRKVIKVLLGEYSRNEIIRQRFAREAAAASRLDHRHIIKIDDFGTLPDGQLFLMMPFLDGRSLEAHLRHNHRPTLHHTFHIIVQLCSALQHLHEAGIVHRDLKPGNVFVCETRDNPYEVVLIDLGIARDVTEETSAFKTQSGIAMGTPGYMAVEQYGNAANASATADVYAAAIITWEMLTGQLPWGVHDARVLYMKQMTEAPRLPPGCELSPGVLALLRRALSVEPSERPGSARAFAVELAANVAAEPPHLPSGAEILARFAREFVERAGPDRATVRHVVSDPAISRERSASARTVAARPAETTLSAASMSAPHRTVPARRWLPLGIAGGVAAAIAVFAVVQRRADTGAPPPTVVNRTSGVGAATPPIVPAVTAREEGAAVSLVRSTRDAVSGAVAAATRSGTPAVDTTPVPPRRAAVASPRTPPPSITGQAFDPEAVEE